MKVSKNQNFFDAVRDFDRLNIATKKNKYILIRAAASKQIVKAKYNLAEFIKFFIK